MRIAAVLLIVTLLSTCAISGTFAKYVAKADFEDSARVAKWGIKIETSGDLFSDKYVAEDEDYVAAGGEYSVKAFNSTDTQEGDKLVAPGTTSYTYNGDGEVTDMGFTARLYGKPEVATRFKLDLTGLEDVYMPFANGYTDYSVAVKDGVEETFDLIGPGAVSGLNNSYVYGYSPVKWDVKVTRVKDDGTKGRSISLSEIAAQVAGQRFGELYEALFTADGISITDAKTVVEQVKQRGLESMIMDKINQQFAGHGFRNLAIEIDNDHIILSMDFDPNENVNYLFEGGWTWAFEQSAPSFVAPAQSGAYTDMYDKADTYLGNVAAGIITDDTVSTDLGFSFVASATQID